MRLKKLQVNSFAGISPNSPVVIDFTKSKFVKMEGDQGRGKTSMINALLVACGQLSKDNKNFVNLSSGKIDMDFDFVGKDGYSYNVRVTKSSFILSYEGVAVPEPITKMKELLGVVGVSHMEIKYKPLEEIIKWLAGYASKNPEEFAAKRDKHKKNIKAARETRAMANKSAKSLDQYLTNEDLYINWEDSEARYTKAVDVKELSLKLDAAGKASDRIIRAEEKLKQHLGSKELLLLEIERIENELEEKKNFLSATESFIVIGTRYIEENKGVKREYDAIKREYDNAAAQSIQYHKWQEVKAKAKEKDDFETIAQKADSQEKEILQALKELQAEILPDIKGLELILEDTHENGGVMRKEGLYLNGLNPAQLSETEWSALVMQIWRKYKVKIIVVDNMQSLGSTGVEWLQKLSNDGAYILAASMDRETKTLQINY